MRIFAVTLAVILSLLSLSSVAPNVWARSTAEAVLWERYETWKRTQDRADLDALVLAMAPLVEPIAEKFSNGYKPVSMQEFAQEAYIQLVAIFQRREFHREKDNLEGFLKTVVRNCSTSLIRHERKRPQSLPMIAEWIANKDPTPAQDFDEKLLREKISKIRGGLYDGHKLLLDALLRGPATYAELAKEFDIPVGTVMSRLHYLRRQLKANLPPEHFSTLSGRASSQRQN